MSRALVSYATGPVEPLLELSAPGMRRYADRHGYELELDPPTVLLVRPPSWGKIPLLLDALDRHDEALWLDADVLILDDDVDVADEVPPEAWHALTRHYTREGEIPSAGVWLVRRPMRRWLTAAWQLTRYIDHPWWEQAAVHQLLGYGGQPVAPQAQTQLLERTHWLGDEWQTLLLENPAGAELADPVFVNATGPRFVHCGPGSSPAYRAELMRELVELAPIEGRT